MLRAFALDTMRIWETNTQNTIIITYKEFLERTIYIEYVLTSMDSNLAVSLI